MVYNFFTQSFYNRVLFETKSFIIIPSVGSIVKGWLLIVPKKFYLNMSYLSRDMLDELIEVINNFDKIYKREFGDYIMFEHGPMEPCSSVGCGVDYAHMHMVPTNFDLIKGISNFENLFFDWKPLNSITDVPNVRQENVDYLYFKDQEGLSYFTQNDKIPSQLFRRVIAHYMGCSANFDWKHFPNYANIEATIDILKNAV